MSKQEYKVGDFVMLVKIKGVASFFTSRNIKIGDTAVIKKVDKNSVIVNFLDSGTDKVDTKKEGVVVYREEILPVTLKNIFDYKILK